jgi:phage gp29-like protein
MNAARTAVVSLTMQVHIKAANVWRDLHNPLRGLTMSRAVSYLEEGERGAYADLQWLYRFIEKRDATLRGGKRSLLSAVSEMDWDIKTVEERRLPKGYTQADAEAQAVALRTAYDAITNLKAALEFLGLAEFRGYSHLEKIEGAPIQHPASSIQHPVITELRPVEQWYWCRDGRNASWHYNAAARSGTVHGDEVDPSRFIVREIDDPINEIALIAFVRKSLGRKDEDGFIESFGIPSIFAVMPQNVPQGREAEYQALADQVISDSRGSLPYGADIKTVDAGARGVAPFRAYQDALDKEIVMAITSGALTMLAESGSGTLAGGAHSDTFMRVARALARRVTEVMQAQFDADILRARFPGQPALAYFEILANEETDVGEVVKDVQTLKAAGYSVEPSWLEEKTGYPIATTSPGQSGPTTVNNRKPQPTTANAPQEPTEAMLAASLDALLSGMHADFRPVAERLQDLLMDAESEADLQAGLELLLEDLPKLAAQVGASNATVTAWQGILGVAAANESVDAVGDLGNARGSAKVKPVKIGTMGGGRKHDPSKHPRDGDGKFADKPGAGDDAPAKTKSEKAKEAGVRIGRDEQRRADELEHTVAKDVGGVSFKDSEPVDVVIGKNGVIEHGIEFKAVLSGKNDKLTMNSYAQVRKIDWEKRNKTVFHTLVADVRGGAKPSYYYRRGVAGSARLGSLHKAKDINEVKRLMRMSDKELPAAAQRTDGKLKSARWKFFEDAQGKGYRDLKTGTVHRAKK